MIPYLDAEDPFPPVDHAMREPNGLLAAGADLSPAAGALELALARLDDDDLDHAAGFLIDSAVMSYCRAFVPSNVREPLSAHLDVPDQFAAVHERNREYRNMVIAHSQSNLSVTLPLVIEQADGSRRAAGWTISQPMPPQLITEFAELIEALATRLDELIDAVATRLEPQLAAAVPLDEAPFAIDHELAETFTARSSRRPYPASQTLYWTRGVSTSASP